MKMLDTEPKNVGQMGQQGCQIYGVQTGHGFSSSIKVGTFQNKILEPNVGLTLKYLHVQKVFAIVTRGAFQLVGPRYTILVARVSAQTGVILQDISSLAHKFCHVSLRDGEGILSTFRVQDEMPFRSGDYYNFDAVKRGADPVGVVSNSGGPPSGLNIISDFMHVLTVGILGNHSQGSRRGSNGGLSSKGGRRRRWRWRRMSNILTGCGGRNNLTHGVSAND